MASKGTYKIIRLFGSQRAIQIWLVVLVVILAVVFALELIVPVFPGRSSGESGSDTGVPGTERPESIWEPNALEVRSVTSLLRPGMFKPSSGVVDRPMADKTVERIKSQLTVQCIMEMNGKRVAYIKIKGEGLQKCMVGERVNDLFTVLEIRQHSVVITIVGHKVTLVL